MTYSETLKSPKWQKKRLEVLNRDNFTCRHCGDTNNTLHVHHREYLSGKKPWEYENENFLTLCFVCHAVTEFLKGIEVIKSFKAKHKENNHTYLVLSIINDSSDSGILLLEYDAITCTVSYKVYIEKETVNIIHDILLKTN